MSKDPLANIVPFELKAKDTTKSSCPLSVVTSVFVSKFHNFIVWSFDPLAKIVPALLNAIDLT